MIQDVVAGLRRLLEPNPAALDRPITVDETGAEPFDWRPETLYVYPTRQAEVGIESGPTVRQDFELMAVLTADNLGEEATHERHPDVATYLDEKAHAYSHLIRHNQSNAIWAHIGSDQSVRPPASLQARALAMRVRGYRIVA